MPKKRPIPKVDTKHYMAQGHITCKPLDNAVSLEVHHCMIYADRREWLALLLSEIKAGQQVWGDSFTTELIVGIEGMA